MAKKAESGTKYSIKTNSKSARKYPNVIWFPRSKTDPREVREVLKLAKVVQDSNPENFFNDKLLGEHMAKIGSINVVGLVGEQYIESYSKKSTGDVSYITNARMLIRLFRFLGLATRFSAGKFKLTKRGEKYCTFSGDFPDFKDNVSEEKMLLDSLADFAFYSANDNATHRNPKFKIRPFVWLLHNLEIEPQCIYQLIVTAFASQRESDIEDERIKTILNELREGKTTLKDEWSKVGLDADNYSCVHNFYDSVKILVYLGISLGLIQKINQPEYGKKISGNAKHLKQATVFYKLTDKGEIFVNSTKKILVYYDDLYEVFEDKQILKASMLLCCLNYKLGKKHISSLPESFFDEDFDFDLICSLLASKFGIEIENKDGYLKLLSPISFSFFQGLPPEIKELESVKNYYEKIDNFLKNDQNVITEEHMPTQNFDEYENFFLLDEERKYFLIDNKQEELDKGTTYVGMEQAFGGQDRFASRVSPTNSVVAKDGELFVNNSIDALDLLVPLRINKPDLKDFVENNLFDLVKIFLDKSDTWEKDQHYTWVRNCFRQLGAEALYSGSGGMLSRADVTVTSPMICGIEAKSPREGRGTLNTKAIRQAVEAKNQVEEKFQDGSIKSSAIAIGRRISPLAITAEKMWAKQNQPVMLLVDLWLHFIVLKSLSVPYSDNDIIGFFTSYTGQINGAVMKEWFSSLAIEPEHLSEIHKQIDLLEEKLT